MSAETIPATPANMRRYAAAGVVAYDRATGESYSADPSDYWYLPDDQPLEDHEGSPLILAVPFSGMRELKEEG